MKPDEIVASKYRLLTRIGQGGMGSVWRVINLSTGREFAIKFLHPSVAHNEDTRSRFVQEARASARINHPNAIDVFDVGENVDGGLYLVMELLDGLSMAEALWADPPFNCRDLLIVLSEACTALHAAHAAGVIHRDLKPANIFLHKDRASGFVTAKVLDFGVSKLLAADDGVATTTGSLLGSPRYMSPEQAISASSADARADIWSIGVVLFEALTGRFPHDGESSNNLIIAIATKPPKLLRDVAPHVPVALQMLIDDCLKPVNERVQTMATLLDRILAILATHDLRDLVLARPLVARGKARVRPEGLMFRTNAGQIPGLASSMLASQGLGSLARHLSSVPAAAGSSPGATPSFPTGPPQSFTGGGSPGWDANAPQPPGAKHATLRMRDPGMRDSSAQLPPPAPPGPVFSPTVNDTRTPTYNALPAFGVTPARNDPTLESVSSVNVVRGAHPSFVPATPAPKSKSELKLAIAGIGILALVAASLVVIFTRGGKATSEASIVPSSADAPGRAPAAPTTVVSVGSAVGAPADTAIAVASATGTAAASSEPATPVAVNTSGSTPGHTKPPASSKTPPASSSKRVTQMPTGYE